jgi:chemosensory pili system protein ChpA (sensor histidine kinase/response regulator)
LPLTLAVAQTVLVRCGRPLWALPAPMVEKVEQMKPEALVELYVQRRVEWQGHDYPFHYLPRLLGDRSRFPNRRARTPCCCCAAGRASRRSTSTK